MARWLKQLFCTHSSRSWTTEYVTETMTRTTGGCVRCGKSMPRHCVRGW